MPKQRYLIPRKLNSGIAKNFGPVVKTCIRTTFKIYIYFTHVHDFPKTYSAFIILDYKMLFPNVLKAFNGTRHLKM